jgi:hypothetical protein
MMKCPSILEEENLLTYEVSDEALETAGGIWAKSGLMRCNNRRQRLLRLTSNPSG